MPTQKDFKRLVRRRMQKTGESYTAARAQLLEHTPGRTSPSAECRGRLNGQRVVGVRIRQPPRYGTAQAAAFVAGSTVVAGGDSLVRL